MTAQITLSVTPLDSGSTGTITLRGKVGGSVPAEGVVVELLVRYRGSWEPFRTPRTNTAGRYSTRYRFEGSVGTFPFRAEVLAGQAGYSYGAGVSRTVAVKAG